MAPIHADLVQLPARRSSPGHVPGCDFFCLRFGVWYSSQDCAYRSAFRTYAGCANCDQGRFNLKRHQGALRRRRWLPVVAPDQE